MTLPAVIAALPRPLALSWPGCGALIFWQLGVLKGLMQSHELSNVPMVGSSSGALITALAASRVDVDAAARRGIELLSTYDVSSRWLGLVGILGPLVRHWLTDVLPKDAGERCSGTSTLLVTTLPFFRSHSISRFSSKEDLINVIMASSHIPGVVDWRMWVACRSRGLACIDGGLWWLLQRSLGEYMQHGSASTLLIQPSDDPALMSDLARYKSMWPGSGTAGEMYALGQQFADQRLSNTALMQQLLADQQGLNLQRKPVA